jgi:hypothetical protein
MPSDAAPSDAAPSTASGPGRRAVVAGTGLAVGASALAAPAEAATGVLGRRSASLLSTRSRHLVGRFSYGVTPALAHEVRRQGGARAWFDWQLSPGAITDKAGDGLLDWFPHLKWSASRIASENDSGRVGGWEVMADYQNWLLLRRMLSRHQVLETMTEFWENHFNVPVGADGVYTYRKHYGDVIRARALDSFESLLQAVSVHPAMGMYLGNAVSDKDHPNENQARELLELHTVGLGAGYHERDVVDSARILTGWRVDMWNTWAAFYDRGSHYRQPVRVLGFRSANSSSDGRKVTREYLHYLAHHPATAAHIAGKLAVAFVSDAPPSSLVKHLARVYLRHRTQIRPVLRALVDSAEFRHSVGDKIRDPENDLVATYRLMGVKVARPLDQDRAAHQLLWQASAIGMMPMSWPAPNGQPIAGAAWASPSRVMGSMSTHYTMAGGWWPNKGIHYRKPTAWLPKPTVRFDHLVDHLSQQILHRPASDNLQQACRESVATHGHEMVDKDHPVMLWLFPRLLTTFFDSPDFLRR